MIEEVSEVAGGNNDDQWNAGVIEIK